MASLTSLSSPTSLQLQFGRRYRGAPSVSIWIRYRAPGHRIRLIPTAGAQAAGGGKGGSWSGADASSDSFAGWSGTDSSEGGGDSQKKGGFGGILGVGLAGVFFAAGITFASLSLINKKTTSGVKQQMKPLTAEQEVLPTSDDFVKVDQVSNDYSAVLPDKERKIDCNSDCETGINKDPLPPIEISDDATGGEVDNIHHFGTLSVQNIKSTGNGVDAIDNAPNQVDLQISPDALNIPVPSDSNPRSPELSAYGAVDSSSDPSSFKDSNNTISSDTTDSVIRHEANLDTVNHVDLSAYNTDSTNHTIDCLEENLSTEETVNSKVSLDFSSEFDGQIPSDTSTSSFTVLESRDIVGSNIKEVVETPAYVLKEQDLEHGAMLQLPAETRTLYPVVLDINETVISETLSASDFDKNQPPKLLSETIDSAEGHKLNESASSLAYSISVLSELNVNEPDISSHNQIERILPFESVLPERPFSNSGIPAPSLVSAALQVPPGKVLVPAVVDQVQGQALAALQVLKVIEADVQPGDLCTRREYARWLVSASSALSRNPVLKVYPAMYIENMTELAFDDVTPEDPDFPYIQGLAEAGMISSKLSRSDLNDSFSGQQDSYLFSPESPLSRQDLVSWKMALEKRQLPEVNRNDLYTCSGYIDIDKINPDAWPALVADLSAGEQGITALAFGYTRLFQPNKPVTKAQAAIALATGDAAEVVGEELTRIEAESLAESAVNAHTALVAQVEKDLNASFEKELATEREKIDAVEKLAEEARLELERLRAEREEENNALIMGRASVESEMEVLSRLRREVEEQLQELMSNKVEISFERDRINKLRKEAESENQVIVQLQYELEVERKALSMARAWAEDEAKRAREQARALQEARDRWERQGIKVVVDEDLQDDASAGITWVTAGEQQSPVAETINRGESLAAKLRAMAAEIKLRSSDLIEKIIQKIIAVISALKQWACDTSKHAKDLHSGVCSKASRSIEELRENASGLSSKASRSIEVFGESAYGFSSSVGDKARRVAEDCKESIDKITQKFKT